MMFQGNPFFAFRQRIEREEYLSIRVLVYDGSGNAAEFNGEFYWLFHCTSRCFEDVEKLSVGDGDGIRKRKVAAGVEASIRQYRPIGQRNK